MEVWALEYRNKDNKVWDIEGVDTSRRIAVARMLDNLDQETTPSWEPEWRVRKYIPEESE